MTKDNITLVSNVENNGKYFKDILINSKKIQKADFDLKSKHNFNFSVKDSLKNLISRNNELHFGIMTGEEIVPIESTEGNVKIPIINKEQLERQLKNIKEKEKIAYVHISTIQFLLKDTFAQGIDSPVQLEIRDDRLRDLNDALIARGRGNLKETKMKFDINIQVGMSLYDINLSDSITIRYKLLRTNFMKKGNHPFSITYQINYALSNSHHSITFKNDRKISIDKLFRPVIELEENKSNGIFGRQNSRIVEDTDNFENRRNARTSTSRQSSFLGPPAFDDSHNNELVKQVNNLSSIIQDMSEKL